MPVRFSMNSLKNLPRYFFAREDRTDRKAKPIIYPPVGLMSMPMPPRNAENTGSPHMPENMYTSTAVRAVWSPKAMPHSMTAKVCIVNGTMPGTVICEQIAMKDADKAERTIYCVFDVFFINIASIYRFLKKSVLDKMKFIKYILSYIKNYVNHKNKLVDN